MKPIIRLPLRYLPKSLSRKDKRKQLSMLATSRKQYPNHLYRTRSKLASFHNKTSKHVRNAQRIYGIQSIFPSRKLSLATGCSLPALKEIVRKGQGAYYSSGSRPNQTAESWGLARLASSLTAGKAAVVDYAIVERGCRHDGKAFHMAQQARKKYNHGTPKSYY